MVVVAFEVAVMTLVKCDQNRHDFTQAQGTLTAYLHYLNFERLNSANLLPRQTIIICISLTLITSAADPLTPLKRGDWRWIRNDNLKMNTNSNKNKNIKTTS